ncbi:hypothetical protein NDU88_007103 [Pleurodeles waltl]|uniref:Uncharacterized protein n=1 Tax=Pleurodeles waltl TaxID=8319 RepID=A0AAV7RPC4_PLEWA|nr:hypothetical protein NDU88_007103 [Pleurodeles waltl]
MCCPVARILETRLLRRPGEASGGRLRHWGRAALELRRVRRGSARIPLRANPGRVSISKAPGKVSREPDSADTNNHLSELYLKLLKLEQETELLRDINRVLREENRFLKASQKKTDRDPQEGW